MILFWRFKNYKAHRLVENQISKIIPGYINKCHRLLGFYKNISIWRLSDLMVMKKFNIFLKKYDIPKQNYNNMKTL